MAIEFNENILGLTPVTKALWLSEFYLKNKRLVYITKDLPTAQTLQQDFKNFHSATTVSLFPDWDTLPFELASVDTKITADRISTLNTVINKKEFIIIAPISGLLRKMLPWNYFEHLIFNLQVGDSYPRKELINQLSLVGFKQVSLVQDIGEMALRGNVIDIFPSTSNNPLRLEFDSSLLKKIKVFDTASQLSHGNIEHIKVLPVREIFPLHNYREFFNSAIQNSIKDLNHKYELPPREANKIIETIEQGLQAPGMEVYSQMACPHLTSLLDYLPNDCVLIYDDYMSIQRNAEIQSASYYERHQIMLSENCLVPEVAHCFLEFNLSCQTVTKLNKVQIGSSVDLEDQSGKVTAYKYSNLDELGHKLMTRLQGSKILEALVPYYQNWISNNYKICFVTSHVTRQSRLCELLNALDIQVQVSNESLVEWLCNPNSSNNALLLGNLSGGFINQTSKQVVVTETELFSKKSRRTNSASFSTPSLKQILATLDKLDLLDFIVHEDYGIGRFRGLAHLTIDGNEGDFLQIEYADSTLYLPAHNITKIKKYLGTEGVEPELDKLSAGKWTKTKERVQQAVAEIAGELINLYATREVAEGTAFDTVNQADYEFADQFNYDETPDQLSAIQATLADMAKSKPMDRLVCGDVGFGKTEVAIRAAYKCLQASKQVAVLAPTTILVEQHFQNFNERFKDYPVKVAGLSRFRPAQENKKTLEELQNGQIDIVIGTHKLLQQNIEFKDLGLLIVDEEHRFGVKQKEKLKQLKKEVDVLTLTATPIPRTLHMALCQVRDISVIATAPPDRRVVQTHIAQRDEALIRSLLIREKQRSGQAFFVHNRVETLPTILASLKELCPELSFASAHGQMKERDLEDVMESFITKQIDVLVCTSIIESGLDIPNANTMIIDRADTFGLAQLYQLRGRVGRSSTQAYCYFLVPPLKKLNNEAYQRLEALKNLDDLGQGFQLALRDLEIRGAGNLLGREQSGNVLAVGYELYTKILNTAILNVRSQASGSMPGMAIELDPEIRIGAQAYLPEVYIPDISERLIIYQRLAATSSVSEIELLSNEIVDRFGGFDQVVQNLLDFTKLKILSKTFLITRIEKVKDKLFIAFHNNAPIQVEKIMQLITKYPNEFKLTATSALAINWQEEFDNTERLFFALFELCQNLSSTKQL